MLNDVSVFSRAKQRHPALFCVIAFAFGIFLDRQCGETAHCFSLINWLLLNCFFLILWQVLNTSFRQYHQLTLYAMLGVLICSGGLIHHLQWNTFAPNQLSRYASEQSSPVRLVARIATKPVFRPNQLPNFATAWTNEDRTRCQAQVFKLIQHSGSTNIRGKIMLTIIGDTTHLQPGDDVVLVGSMRNISPARNPAGFDFSQFMRQQKILTSVFCRSPEAVTRLQEQSWSVAQFFVNIQQAYRTRLRAVFTSSLSEENPGIAIALLLGERQSLDEDVLLTFRRSGLMHLLSISGLHVGLIASLFFLFGRVINLSQRTLFLLMFAGITYCLFVAQLRPPVLRAWLIGSVFIAGWSLQKNVGFLQSLAISAWLILIYNPAWLFDRGTQLSFLAIFGIFGLQKGMPGLFLNKQRDFIFEQNSVSLLQTAKEILQFLGRFYWQSLVISLAITVLAIPLLASSFDRVTLAGIPATILSLPVLGIALIGLILLGGVGFVSTTLASWIAIPVNWLLSLLSGIAEFFSNESLLQWTSSKPQQWWILALYIFAAIAFYYSSKINFRYKAGLIATWLLLVVFTVSNFQTNGNFECRALSVGHGNAVLVKCPNGKTILLDGGSMQNGQFAASVIQENLAQMGADRLDAVLISHADTDHLNAVPFLIEQIPIRTILLNPSGLNPFHPAMQAIVTRAKKQNLPLQCVQAGDFLELDEDVRILIKQCPASPLEKMGNDNADSIVVEIEYQGKKLLFPGDLENEGQTRLLKKNSSRYDFLMAPHHGGKHENTTKFAKWTKPKNVIVSSNDTKMHEHLQTVYDSNSTLFFTSQGAIRLQITPAGKLKMSQWQPKQFWKTAPN